MAGGKQTLLEQKSRHAAFAAIYIWHRHAYHGGLCGMQRAQHGVPRTKQADYGIFAAAAAYLHAVVSLYVTGCMPLSGVCRNAAASYDS